MSQLPIQTDTSAVCRETGGDIPTKRKGGSLTVHENSAYLFGGLLLDNTTAVSDLYVLDLTTLQWSFISNDDFTPRPRYFHSADRWGDYLVIFGGRSVRQNSATNAFEAFDLDDIQFFHLPSRRWQTQQLPPRSSDVFKPHARYAHISSISGDTLYIFGGQDIHDQWFDEIIVYSLSTRSWIVQHGYPMHIGRYRSTVASFPLSVEFPDTEDDTDSDIAGGTRRRQSAKKLVHLPYTKRHTSADPPAAYLFTNINGADKQLRRYLHTLVPLHDQEGDFTLDNQSRSMGGTPPPGLRFPSSHLAGSHLLVSGVTAHGQNYVFCVYTLDLGTMRWSALHLDYLTYRTGSWHTAAYWPNQNKFLILGDKSSSMTEDYTRRAMSFDHAIVIDLESFGIYQPPEQLADVSAQELGLAALKGQQYTDFELVCDDGRSISCSRKVLEERWPWLKERIQAVRRAGNNAKDRRLTPQAFRLCEPFPTTLALLQYFYSQALITPLQHSPSIRNQLMVIATSYGIPHLAALTRHAMHHDLTTATADSTAKIASICGYPSLQSRALRMVRVSPLASFDAVTRHEPTSLGARPFWTIFTHAITHVRTRFAFLAYSGAFCRERDIL
ncbi:galactose oxidase [Flagelloscypha sp. PMI_526]|nr:galactose oxidase [Flagelloscypha sp. PMI_526]